MANTRNRSTIKKVPTQRVSSSSISTGRGATSVNLRRRTPTGATKWLSPSYGPPSSSFPSVPGRLLNG